MDPSSRQALEAILFVVDEPVELSTLSQVLEVGRDVVESTLRELAEAYRDEQRGFVLREVAGGWRLYTAPGAAPYVERFVLQGRSGRLTQAALETLAVVAYKQPISRQEIGDIRGVNADAAVRTLVQRGLVEEVDRDEGPGQAILYGTSRTFLERMGLRDLHDLPALTEFLQEEPAPDEPRSEDLKQARRELARGRELPSTGAARWEAGEPGTPADEPLEDEETEVEVPEMEVPDVRAEARDRLDARRREESEMADLTAALERAAASAVSQLKEAMAATDAPEDDDGDGGADPAEGST